MDGAVIGLAFVSMSVERDWLMSRASALCARIVHTYKLYILCMTSVIRRPTFIVTILLFVLSLGSCSGSLQMNPVYLKHRIHTTYDIHHMTFDIDCYDECRSSRETKPTILRIDCNLPTKY